LGGLDQGLYFLERRIIKSIILRKEYITGSMDQGLYFLERRIIIFVISRKINAPKKAPRYGENNGAKKGSPIWGK
jgi:hypothetical protein